MRIAWRAWLAERGTMQRLERPSEAQVAERARGYFRWRLEEALEVLGSDSTALAEVLNEIFALVIGEEVIETDSAGTRGNAPEDNSTHGIVGMTRAANRHGKKAGKRETKDGALPRGLRRSLDLACDLFLLPRGLKGRGAFRFGAKR
jgi:hypothetical protein